MIVVIQCKDQVGLVAGITGVLAKEQLNIVSLREHVDKIENRFFIRVHIEQETDSQSLEQKLQQVLPSDAVIKVNPQPEKKVVVLVTREYHCLADILIRNHFKTLGARVQCVIGNYDTLQNISQRFDIPFYLVSHEEKDKAGFEKQIAGLIDKYAPDYIVLAKFMRILSPEFVAKYSGSIINIHHSFLPAFVGASPYKQAFERGVKLIGATAHFVTNELDYGPFIAKHIIPLTHPNTSAYMMNAGK